MNKSRLYQILKGPVFSEKSQMLGENYGVQVFKVDSSATKLEIKKAVETLFNVKVEKVNTLNIKGKSKRFGRTIGKRNDIKKAYVTLVADQQIEALDNDAAADANETEQVSDAEQTTDQVQGD